MNYLTSREKGSLVATLIVHLGALILPALGASGWSAVFALLWTGATVLISYVHLASLQSERQWVAQREAREQRWARERQEMWERCGF